MVEILKLMLNQDPEIEIYQDWCKNLWYELNPRVRCAYGNVFQKTSSLSSKAKPLISYFESNLFVCCSLHLNIWKFQHLSPYTGNWHMCCSQHLNETVAWGVSGTRLQEWIPGVESFKTSLKIMKPSWTTHWQRCLTLTPTEESLIVIPSQRASASKWQEISDGEKTLIAGKIPKLHDWSNSFFKGRTWQHCELASSTSEVLENHKCPAI